MTESTQDHTNKIYDEHGFLIIRQFIPSFFTVFLREYFDTLNNTNKLENGDSQAPNSSCVYGDPCFDTFMLMSTDMISRAIGKELLPTYTYGRIYYTGSELLPHLDREECEHSMTLFLGGKFDMIWPIWLMNKEVHRQPQLVDLTPGDCVIYKGNKVHHWRDGFEGTSHYQLFLHFVEKNGKYKDRVFDTRPYIGLPSDTKQNYEHSDDQSTS